MTKAATSKKSAPGACFEHPGFDFWSRISGFGLRVSGFGFRFPGFGFRGSGFGFRVSSIGVRIPGFGFRVWGFGLRASGFGCGCSLDDDRVSGSGFRGSGFGFRGSGFALVMMPCSVMSPSINAAGCQRERLLGWTEAPHGEVRRFRSICTTQGSKVNCVRQVDS